MIIKVLHKTFAMLLACLVLLSTVSFTVEKHFCGDVLVDSSIFSKPEKCGMEMSTSKAHHTKKRPCCKDEIDVVQGQKVLKTSSFDDIHFQKQVFFASLFYAYLGVFDVLPKEIVPHKDYSPPNLVVDIQVLDQVFII